MKVLVTGASGMLGRAVAEALLRRGDQVRTFQRRPSGLAGTDGHEERRGDLLDPAALAEAVHGTDAVVHLAARVVMHGPWPPFEAANVDGVRHLLAAIRAAGVGRLVHVSSPSVAHHGASLVGRGADPADPARAHGSYARSKAIGERLALEADGQGLAVVAVRPHLVWGPGDTQLVGRILDRARSGRMALLGNGAALIDTTYVTNAADALVAALDRVEHAHGEAFVVSNGEPRPVGELVAGLCRAAGVPVPTRRVPYRLAWTAGAAVEGVWAALRLDREPPVTRFLAEHLATAHWFDQRRTREALDWTPAVSLDEGLALLAEHHRRAG